MFLKFLLCIPVVCLKITSIFSRNNIAVNAGLVGFIILHKVLPGCYRRCYIKALVSSLIMLPFGSFSTICSDLEHRLKLVYVFFDCFNNDQNQILMWLLVKIAAIAVQLHINVI